MALVNAKCTSCGANLEVDGTQDAAICKYCGTAFIVEKAVNNYNIASAQINAQTVIINKNTASDFKIINGELERYYGNDKDVVVPDNVFLIKANAFSKNRQVESILVPESVREFEMGSFNSFAKTLYTPFNDCENLKKITFSNRNISLHKDVFWGCGNLSEINFNGGLKIYDSVDNIATLPYDLDTKNLQKAEVILDFFPTHGLLSECLMNGIDISEKLELLEDIQTAEQNRQSEILLVEAQKTESKAKAVRAVGIFLIAVWVFTLLLLLAGALPEDAPVGIPIVLGLCGLAGIITLIASYNIN
jgi:DNA-directed RNA polymerase subunit RPC12/RpoP